MRPVLKSSRRTAVSSFTIQVPDSQVGTFTQLLLASRSAPALKRAPLRIELSTEGSASWCSILPSIVYALTVCANIVMTNAKRGLA